MDGPKTFQNWFAPRQGGPPGRHTSRGVPACSFVTWNGASKTGVLKYHDSPFRVGLGLPTRIPKEQEKTNSLLAQDVNVPGRRTMQTSVSRLGLPVKWTGIPEESPSGPILRALGSLPYRITEESNPILRP
jgi:hypothetical protein